MEGCRWLKNKENLGGNELAVCWRGRDIRFREAQITGQNLFLKNEGFVFMT